MSEKYKFADEGRTLSVALCPPAVRMIVVHVWADDDDSDHRIYPVVAIRSTVRRLFSKGYREKEQHPRTSGTEKDLLERGWHFDNQREETTALIVDDDYGIIGYQDEMIQADNAGWQLLCPSWPIEEDAERLKPIVKRLESEIREKKKLLEKMRATKST